MCVPKRLRLGLIGDHIAESKAPLLHELAGRCLDIPTTYTCLVPAELDRSFEDVFAQARDDGFDGLNITYPYKERAVPLVRPDSPELAQLGAINTVVFEAQGPRGYNTDMTGFIAAFCARFTRAPPGRVALLGAGGVARAVAFALARLGTRELILTDLVPARAATLKTALARAFETVNVQIAQDAADCAAAATGVVNCTPVGMYDRPGTPLDAQHLRGKLWAFDAVYTPEKTRFLSDARTAGAATLSGFELFFHQGVHAYRLFSGREFDETAFRPELTAALEVI
ncbi:MAG: shikimate dehydrogenase [Pseudomonadota bacterium]